MTVDIGEKAVDLYAPFERDTILEIRTGRMKNMPELSIKTGIDKQLVEGKIKVTLTGLEDDEHDPTFHGGREKAVHGYCSSHYATWALEHPSSASRFVPGGFGENFVTAHMNERNVCIGDIVSVGAEVLLQVCLPRQPCFKLNHRFRVKNFAPQTYKTSRTGWYYRVLQEGYVQAGDEIRLVERVNPEWTVERVQEYLHRNVEDEEMNAVLAELPALGEESKKIFATRVAKAKARAKRAAREQERWREFRIVEKNPVTKNVTAFVLEAVKHDEDASDGLRLGSHVRLQLPNGLSRSYSIVSGSENRFEIGVKLEEKSRGGSAYLHRETSVGDVIKVGRITSDVGSVNAASNHVFIVGGIGITAFVSMLQKYRRINYETRLHYAVRSSEEFPFRDRLDGVLGECLKVYDASKGERMDIPAIFRGLCWNSHVYVCGPRRMMDEAAAEAKKCGLGEDEVHFEAFAADATGDPFEVEVANREGKVLKVEGEETLLDVLRKHFDVPSSCEVGNCGTCKVGLKSGCVDHRGTALKEEEKKGAMLSCVSRGIGKISIEI